MCNNLVYVELEWKIIFTMSNIGEKRIPMNMEIFTGKISRPAWRTTESTSDGGESIRNLHLTCRLVFCGVLKGKKYTGYEKGKVLKLVDKRGHAEIFS